MCANNGVYKSEIIVTDEVDLSLRFPMVSDANKLQHFRIIKFNFLTGKL